MRPCSPPFAKIAAPRKSTSAPCVRRLGGKKRVARTRAFPANLRFVSFSPTQKPSVSSRAVRFCTCFINGPCAPVSTPRKRFYQASMEEVAQVRAALPELGRLHRLVRRGVTYARALPRRFALRARISAASKSGRNSRRLSAAYDPPGNPGLLSRCLGDWLFRGRGFAMQSQKHSPWRNPRRLDSEG